jgi:hypothetical protein
MPRAAGRTTVLVALLVLAGLAGAWPADAQSVAWTSQYDGPGGLRESGLINCDDYFRGNDYPRALALDDAGNIYAGGNEGFDSIVAVKTDPSGRGLWTRRQHGSYSCGFGGLAVDAQRNVYVVGSARLPGTWDRTGLHIIKYAPDGMRLWRAQYDDPRWRIAEATHVAVDAHGQVYVTATMSYDLSTPNQVLTMKFAADGRRIWVAADERISYSARAVYALRLDADGNPQVLIGIVPREQDRVLQVVKYAALDGRELWSVAPSSQGIPLRALGMVLDAADAAYVLACDSNGHRTLLKYGSDGQELWRQVDLSAYTTAGTIAIDERDNIYIAMAETRARVMRLAVPDGAVVWDRHYNFTYDNLEPATALPMVVGANGELFLRGHRYLSPRERVEELAGLDSDDGHELWRTVDNDHVNVMSKALVVDSHGDLMTLSHSHAWGEWRPPTVSKYDGRDGRRLAIIGFEREESPGDIPAEGALAIDATGAAYVGGSSNNTGRLIKHTPTGQIAWVATLDRSRSIDRIALDADGNVFALAAAPRHLALAKYAPDGTLAWLSTFPVSAVFGSVVGLSTDADGHAYVLGYAGSDGSDPTWQILKYAPDGRLLWRAAPPGGADLPTALRVDAVGNVAVLGNARRRAGHQNNRAMLTAKYAAHDGTLLWSQRVEFGSDGTVRPAWLEFDDVGNVSVLGVSSGGNEPSTGRFYRYAAGDGRLLWQADVHANVWLEQVTTDAAGDFYTVGSSVTKYAGTTGALLWRTPLPAAHVATQYLWPTAVVADGFGRVLVAGYARSNNFNEDDAWSAVYDAASGDLRATLWRDDGGRDEAMAIATDSAGGVYVAGASDRRDEDDDDNDDFDIITTKYVAGPPAADLRVTIDDELTSAAPGATVTYRVRAANGGPVTAPAARIRSTFPTQCREVRWTCDSTERGGCSGSGAIDHQVDLAVGVPVLYTAVCVLRRDATGALTSNVSVGSALTDPDPTNNVANDTNTLTPITDLALELRSTRNPVPVQGQVTYAVNYANRSATVVASRVALRLLLPPALSFVSSSLGSDCRAQGASVRCTLGTLDVEAQGTLTVVAQLAPGYRGELLTLGTISGHEDEFDFANNSAQARTLARLQPGDIQNDLATDLLLQHVVSGELRAWLLDGTTRLSEASFEPALPTHATQRLVGMADFDGDLHNDLLLRDSATDTLEFWLMDGLVRRGGPLPLAQAPSLPATWRLRAIADLGRNGGLDLVWQDETTNRLTVWTLQGTTWLAAWPLGSQAPDSSWELVGMPDLNGDELPDAVWYERTSGKLSYWWLNEYGQRIAGTYTTPAAPSDNAWRVTAVGDFGVGPGGQPNTVDLLWRNELTGRLAVWHMGLAGQRTAGTFLNPDRPDDALAWQVLGPR